MILFSPGRRLPVCGTGLPCSTFILSEKRQKEYQQVLELLKDSVNAVIEYVNSGVPFENLSRFQREKLLAFYDISVSMLQRHYSNLYGIECVLNEFIEAVTSYDKLDEDEIRKYLR